MDRNDPPFDGFDSLADEQSVVFFALDLKGELDEDEPETHLMRRRDGSG